MSRRPNRELAKVIAIPTGTTWSTSPKYTEAVESTVSILETVSSRIFTAMVNLAFAGEWRDKNDEYAVGTRVHFSPADFEGGSDPRVQQLLRAYLEVESALAGFVDFSASGEVP